MQRSLLVIWLFLCLVEAKVLNFPDDIVAKSVKEYGAKGDGQTDDFDSIMTALADNRPVKIGQPDYYSSRPKLVYFPKGVYVTGKSINWHGCAVTLQGQGIGETIIKLKDNAAGFDNVHNPRAVIVTPNGNQSFRENIHDLTINTGSNNPGAIGIDYISNNSGTLKDVAIISEDGDGAIGLAMTRLWPGPCLVKNVTIDGFGYGIKTGETEYSIVLEHIILRNQKICGIHNSENILTMRRIRSENAVPACVNADAGGLLSLVDCEFINGSGPNFAIENSGSLFARNVITAGYRGAIKSGDREISRDTLEEFVTDTAYTLFDSPARTLNLPIAETPSFHDNNLNNWAKHTVRPQDGSTPTTTFKELFTSGKSTIYSPASLYLMNHEVEVPAHVKRVIGFNSVVHGIPNGVGLTLQVNDNSSDPLIIERYGYGVTVKHNSKRTVVLKHGGYDYMAGDKPGDLFLEDAMVDELKIDSRRNVWIRSVNSEPANPDFRIYNRGGGAVWIFGIKTEGKGGVITTENGSMTEVLGGLLYPSTAFSSGDLEKPAFLVKNAHASFSLGWSTYTSDGMYTRLVRETRQGLSRTLEVDSISGRILPLFAGYDSLELDQMQQPVRRWVHAWGNTLPQSSQRFLHIEGFAARPTGSKYAEWFDIRGRRVGLGNVTEEITDALIPNRVCRILIRVQ
ncbi:MAG: hypothetical protein GF398_00495 [Chitinivibrionales bacterium]|nr:hypothetical protein [Chitinivibrionales bacterium]